MEEERALKYSNGCVLRTRNLILRAVSGVYLCAFLSFYYQSPGLFGKHGILPAYLQLSSTNNGIISAIHENPTLLHFSSFLGLDTDYMMDVLSLIGVVISIMGLSSEKFCVLSTYAASWALYYSLIRITQSFQHQSDLLLLEVGFLCLMLAPMKSLKQSTVSDRIGIILLKWTLFRFMFDSGVVKFFSGCPQWWNFSGLAHHFETLPLPTTFSWYSHHMPATFMKLGNIYTNLSELVCPWLFFVPNRTARIFLFYWEMYLQLCIIFSGNYGFLNFLVIALLLSLLDDEYLANHSIFRLIIKTGIASGVCTLMLFVITVMIPGYIDSVAFKQKYIEILRLMTQLSAFVPLIAIFGTLLTNITSNTLFVEAKTFYTKLSNKKSLLLYTLFSVAIIGLSVVPHSNVDPAANITSTQLGKFYQAVKRYNIINEYGKHLIKMRTERYEVNLEYAQDVNEAWKEIEFVYKPWNTTKYSPFAGPYLPRLDMKFYDISNTNYRKHMWLLSLVYRILQNEHSVLKLFGIEELKRTPKYIRGILSTFKYTMLNESTNNLWTRKVIKEYFPAFSLENPTFQNYLKSIKITLSIPPPAIKNIFLKKILDFIRQQVNLFEGHTLIFCIFIAVLVIIALKK